MENDIFKYAIALTGSIATGKSSTVKILQEHGFKIIDADKIAHILLDLHATSISSLFGEQYVKDKKVLRKDLGKLIFSNKKEKEKLEKFLHPLIKKEIEKEAKLLQKEKKVYFIDLPLFFENMKYPISKCLLIYTNKKLQLQRLQIRDNINEQEALLKISNQIDIEEKKSLADFIINNNSSLENLKIQTKKFIKEINDLY